MEIVESLSYMVGNPLYDSTVSTKSSREMSNPETWGPRIWDACYLICMGFPEKSTASERLGFALFFDSLRICLPCPTCRAEFSEYLKKNPITPNDLLSRNSIFKWVYKVHCSVSNRTGKKNLPPLETIMRNYCGVDSKFISNGGNSTPFLQYTSNAFSNKEAIDLKMQPYASFTKKPRLLVSRSQQPTVFSSRSPTPVVSRSPTPVVSRSPTPVVSQSPTPVVSRSPTLFVSQRPTLIVSQSPTIVPRSFTPFLSSNPPRLISTSPTLLHNRNPGLLVTNSRPHLFLSKPNFIGPVNSLKTSRTQRPPLYNSKLSVMQQPKSSTGINPLVVLEKQSEKNSNPVIRRGCACNSNNRRR